MNVGVEDEVCVGVIVIVGVDVGVVVIVVEGDGEGTVEHFEQSFPKISIIESTFVLDDKFESSLKYFKQRIVSLITAENTISVWIGISSNTSGSEV